MIRLDAKEKTKCNPNCGPHCIHKMLLEAADEVASLRVDHEGVARFYDLEVTTKCGQVLRAEVKWNWEDALGTYVEREENGHSRFSRQLSYVDFCIIILDETAVEMNIHPEQRAAFKGMKNWLARKTLEADPPVLVFSCVADALAFISYLEARKEPIRLAPRPGSLSISAGIASGA